MREEQIRAELEKGEMNIEHARTRIEGSFRKARTNSHRSTSPGVLRLAILLFLVLWVIGIFEIGMTALYGILILVPFYFYLKFRKPRQ